MATRTAPRQPTGRPCLFPAWGSVRSRPAGAGEHAPTPRRGSRHPKPVFRAGYRSRLDSARKLPGIPRLENSATTKAAAHPPGPPPPSAAGPADRRQRQDALLDEALKETFPASDPVSVALVE
jgi:hypothetical protein